MRVCVSACLLGHLCKYNGGHNRNDLLCQWLQQHEVIPVCPEVLGGLPIPRTPAEIVGQTVITADGRNVEFEYRSGAAKALEIAITQHADLLILQSRSPSCGVNQINDGTFSRTRIAGHGIFAQLALDHGFRVIDVEDFPSLIQKEDI